LISPKKLITKSFELEPKLQFIMKNILALSILLVVFLANTCNEYEQVAIQSVQIDYNVIPVWYFLKTGKPEKAKEAAVNLNTYLTLLHEEYKCLFQDKGTEEVFTDLENAMMHLHYLIERAQYEIAIDQAYMIVFKLSDWRSTVENEHFIDIVWDFGRSYENAKQVINDVELCLLEWRDFEKMAIDLEDSWARVEGANVNEYLSELFTEKERTQYDFLVKTIASCIEDFDYAMMAADREEVAEFCNDIEPAYVQLIGMFGEFEPYLKPLPDLDWEDIQITVINE